MYLNSYIKRMSVDEKPVACGIMFRKKLMLDIGLYDTTLHIGEDVDFRIRFDKYHVVERINMPLYRYRMHKENLTMDEIKNRKFLARVASKNGCNVDHSYHATECLKHKI